MVYEVNQSSSARAGMWAKSLVLLVTSVNPRSMAVAAIPARLKTGQAGLSVMKQKTFAPGFRLSGVDVFVLVGGAAGAVALSMFVWWWGLVSAFVLAHFFLFCNVIRMSRPLELIWAGIFVVLAGATIAFDEPGWLISTLASLLVTVLVVTVEMCKPSYHGIAWQRLNPGLPEWWEASFVKKSREADNRHVL
ncbi:MAG: hypothetical protein KF861_02365 [Planctomycetaceae bacterium]|nr:hypothetical protein [Planctomycetaceae bacterium]